MQNLSLSLSRSLCSPPQVRESPLKSQTRVITPLPSGSGFAVGSTGGRVAVDYLRGSGGVRVFFFLYLFFDSFLYLFLYRIFCSLFRGAQFFLSFFFSLLFGLFVFFGGGGVFYYL